MNTNQTFKYTHNLAVGDRFISGMTQAYTVKSLKVVPGFRRASVVIETVEGPTVIRPHGSLATLA